MTDGLRKSHLRKAPQVGLSEVGLPEGNQTNWQNIVLLNAGGAKCEELSGQPDGRRRDPVQSPGNK